MTFFFCIQGATETEDVEYPYMYMVGSDIWFLSYLETQQ